MSIYVYDIKLNCKEAVIKVIAFFYPLSYNISVVLLLAGVWLTKLRIVVKIVLDEAHFNVVRGLI